MNLLYCLLVALLIYLSTGILFAWGVHLYGWLKGYPNTATMGEILAGTIRRDD